MTKITGYDMQGTLTDNKCSDEFWMETLPRLNAQHKKITLKESKKELYTYFKKIGKYDKQYYDQKYWLKKLNVKTELIELLQKQKNKPKIYSWTRKLLSTKQKKVLITSTTKEFINIELGTLTKHFHKIYSTIDDLNIAGKPTHAYKKICSQLKIKPEELIYIGDNKEMDEDNPQKIGIKIRKIKEIKKNIKR